MALPNPHPGIEVAIVGPLGDGALAHEAKIATKNHGTEMHPKWTINTVAKCTKQTAVSFSGAWAQLRGAKPCPDCWGPKTRRKAAA